MYWVFALKVDPVLCVQVTTRVRLLNILLAVPSLGGKSDLNYTKQVCSTEWNAVEDCALQQVNFSCHLIGLEPCLNSSLSHVQVCYMDVRRGGAPTAVPPPSPLPPGTLPLMAAATWICLGSMLCLSYQSSTPAHSSC